MTGAGEPASFEILERTARFRCSATDLGMSMVYDMSHDLARFEEYNPGGRVRNLVVSWSRESDVPNASPEGGTIYVQRRLPGGKSL